MTEGHAWTQNTNSELVLDGILLESHSRDTSLDMISASFESSLTHVAALVHRGGLPKAPSALTASFSAACHCACRCFVSDSALLAFVVLPPFPSPSRPTSPKVAC